MFVPIVASERPLAWISQRASAAPTQQSASPGCGVATFPGEEHGLRNTTRACLRLLGHSIIVTATGCILALSTAASAANKAPDKIQGDCISSECHSTMGKAAFVHGPVEGGDCVTCHAQPEEGRHRFDPVPAGETPICYDCHDAKNTGKFIHGPVESGECTACHDPHESPNKFLLRKPGAELCWECHENDKTNFPFVHGPAAVGACEGCHDPHSSNYEMRLRAPGNDMCFQCHEDKKEALTAQPHIHKPVKDKCISCHSPHGTAHKFQLLDEPPGLCLGCHKEIAKQLAEVTTKHGALARDKTCLNCHDAHASPYAKQLLLPPMDLCLSCHDKAMETPTEPIIDMKQWLADNPDHHGPIREQDCTACHDPHGSKNMRILRKAFPKTFYAPFDEKNYALCFGCHQPTLVKEEKTTTLTGFRDGERNLHFLHVNRKVKGRTCRACHEPHASKQPKHIRDTVPFGSWALPINYEKTESGGKCAPGCHVPKEYNREVRASAPPGKS